MSGTFKTPHNWLVFAIAFAIPLVWGLAHRPSSDAAQEESAKNVVTGVFVCVMLFGWWWANRIRSFRLRLAGTAEDVVARVRRGTHGKDFDVDTGDAATGLVLRIDSPEAILFDASGEVHVAARLTSVRDKAGDVISTWFGTIAGALFPRKASDRPLEIEATVERDGIHAAFRRPARAAVATLTLDGTSRSTAAPSSVLLVVLALAAFSDRYQD